MNGYSINTDFCRIVLQLKGVAKNNAWDPATNSIYVSLTQGKKLREAIKDTTVQILGDRQASMYINGTKDAATRATDLSATAGRNFTVLGKNIKVAGTDPSVSITLTVTTQFTNGKTLLATPRHASQTIYIGEAPAGGGSLEDGGGGDQNENPLG